MDAGSLNSLFRFSDSAGSPLYMQLAAFLRQQIKVGALRPGERMISETSLCEILGISRTTVRQSMNLLVEDGLLLRYRGRGTFVANAKIKRNMSHLYSFTEDMKALAIEPLSKVIRAELVASCPDEIAGILELPSDQERIFYLERVRFANAEPILWESTYIPYRYCNGIENIDFQKHSLYQVLCETYHLSMYRAHETLDAIILSKKESALLECSPGVAGYKISRISYLDTGGVFEHTRSVTRADKCTFQFDLYKYGNSYKMKPAKLKRNLKLSSMGKDNALLD